MVFSFLFLENLYINELNNENEFNFDYENRYFELFYLIQQFPQSCFIFFIIYITIILYICTNRYFCS